MSKLELTRCAACWKEKPVSEMKTCMHNQMHRYVCDAKCMNDFYNPPPKQDQHAADKERIADLEAALSRAAAWIEKLPVPTKGACAQLARIDAALAQQGKENTDG